MIEIAKVKSSELVPETKEESFGELMGRYNALHDVLMDTAKHNATTGWRSEPLDSDLRVVCIIMGFDDVLAIEKEGKKANEDDTSA